MPAVGELGLTTTVVAAGPSPAPAAVHRAAAIAIAETTRNRRMVLLFRNGVIVRPFRRSKQNSLAARSNSSIISVCQIARLLRDKNAEYRAITIAGLPRKKNGQQIAARGEV